MYPADGRCGLSRGASSSASDLGSLWVGLAFELADRQTGPAASRTSSSATLPSSSRVRHRGHGSRFDDIGVVFHCVRADFVGRVALPNSSNEFLVCLGVGGLQMAERARPPVVASARPSPREPRRESSRPRRCRRRTARGQFDEACCRSSVVLDGPLFLQVTSVRLLHLTRRFCSAIHALHCVDCEGLAE